MTDPDMKTSFRGAMPDSPVDDSDLGAGVGALVRFVRMEKWLIVAITGIFSITSVAYALMATEWYQAEVLLAPADDKAAQGLASQFGGFASLAGISLAREGTAEPVATLRSRDFARKFIEEKDLMPILFEDAWDADRARWQSNNPEQQPDIRDGIRMFREDLVHVSEDPKTGLVTLRVEWKDASTASDWANEMVLRLNRKMRERALNDAETNVRFLQSELQGVNVLTIQQSIGRLLEAEMQKLMLARGNTEFSFRVIDPATAPKYRSRPRRTLLVLTSTLFGGIVAVFAVFLLRSYQRSG